MLPCEKCAYKKCIPGNWNIGCDFANIGCDFAWFKASPETMLKIPTTDKGKGQRWFNFPLNYDPLWGPNKCPAFAKERDDDMTIKPSPLMELARILGG